MWCGVLWRRQEVAAAVACRSTNTTSALHVRYSLPDFELIARLLLLCSPVLLQHLVVGVMVDLQASSKRMCQHIINNSGRVSWCAALCCCSSSSPSTRCSCCSSRTHAADCIHKELERLTERPATRQAQGQAPAGPQSRSGSALTPWSDLGCSERMRCCLRHRLVEWWLP